MTDERIDALTHEIELLKNRLAASERRSAQATEAISEELGRTRDRFNARMDMLARDLCERMEILMKGASK